jgi:serine protease Do
MDNRFSSGYDIVAEWERKRNERLLYEQRMIRRRLRFRMFAGLLAGILLTAGVLSAAFLFKESFFYAGNQSRDIIISGSSVQSADAGSSPDGPFVFWADGSSASDGSGNPSSSGPIVSAGSGTSDPTGSDSEGALSGVLPESAIPNQVEQPADMSAAGAATQNGQTTGLLPLSLEKATGSEMTVSQIYDKVSPSIIGVRITFSSPGYSFGRFMMPDQEESGEGSGIIISKDGYIMTNYHVVSKVVDNYTKKPVEGSKIEVFMPNDESMTPISATLVGFDSNTDLAVLKIERTGLVAAELGNPDDLKIGELAVAIGNPGGMEYMSSCTVGVISGLNRTIQTEGYKNIQLIQTDAAINPGNSGGALINSRGQVIGVNSIKIAASTFEGLGFAIPINKAVEICNDLISYTYVKGRPQVGITAYSQYTEELAARYSMPQGVYVYEVEANGPADKAGIKKNDIIVKLDNAEIKNFDDLEKAKNKHKPNEVVDVRVYRDWSANNYSSGIYVDIKLTLGEMTN